MLVQALQRHAAQQRIAGAIDPRPIQLRLIIPPSLPAGDPPPRLVHRKARRTCQRLNLWITETSTTASASESSHGRSTSIAPTGTDGQVKLLPGADVRAFVDIDSLLRPVHGHHKQGAPYGRTKIAGKQVRAMACPRWSPR